MGKNDRMPGYWPTMVILALAFAVMVVLAWPNGV